MKSLKNKIFNYKYDKDGKLFKVLLVFFAIFWGIFTYQVGFLFQVKLENTKLNSLRSNYEELVKEINSYNLLKTQYEVILKNGDDLSTHKKDLEQKVNELNNDIKDLEIKINDINKKIKSIS